MPGIIPPRARAGLVSARPRAGEPRRLQKIGRESFEKAKEAASAAG